jgi:hypothetical protein
MLRFRASEIPSAIRLDLLANVDAPNRIEAENDFGHGEDSKNAN